MEYKIGDKVRLLESVVNYVVDREYVGKIGKIIFVAPLEIFGVEPEGKDFTLRLKKEHFELVEEEIISIKIETPQVQFNSANKELFLELTNVFLEQGYVIYSYMDEKNVYHLEGYYDR